MPSPVLHFAHICDSAFLSKDNKLNIIGIFEKIYSPKFPFRYPKMTVVLNVEVEQGSHKFRIQIIKKGKETPVLKMEGDISAAQNNSFNLIADFQNIPFEDQRQYDVEVIIDEEKLTVLHFAVELLPQREST